MKNKLLSFLLIFTIFNTLSNTIVFASTPNDISNNESTITYFDDGMYCITTTDFNTSYIATYSTTKTGSKTSTYYNSSNKAVCAIKLTGTFTYDSESSVKCTNVSYTTYKYDSNWSIENVTTSSKTDVLSATATASYKVIHRSLGIIINRASDSNYVRCTVYGVLS